MAFYAGAGQEVRVYRDMNNVHDLTCDLDVIFDAQQQMAQQVLTQFQEHPDAWTRVPEILERSSFPQTKVCVILTSDTLA